MAIVPATVLEQLRHIFHHQPLPAVQHARSNLVLITQIAYLHTVD
jgi:hypothetical protein